MPKGQYKRKATRVAKEPVVQPTEVSAVKPTAITEETTMPEAQENIQPSSAEGTTVTPPRIDVAEDPTDEIIQDDQTEPSSEGADYLEDPNMLQTRDAAIIKKKWSAEEKVMFFIPQEPSEKGIVYESVSVNGYAVLIKKNVYVSIPMSVAKILAEAYRVTLNVGKAHRINEDPRKIEALS